MPLSSRSNQYGQVFGDWTIRKKISPGNKKTIVYQVVCKHVGWDEFCALKVIPITSERGVYNNLSDRRRKEYQDARDAQILHAEQEVRCMSEMRGNTNIVDYINCKAVDWEDEDENEFGCDFLILMELLCDLGSELEKGHIFSENEVIQIGKDICTALVLCHGKNIFHRDIKP